MEKTPPATTQKTGKKTGKKIDTYAGKRDANRPRVLSDMVQALTGDVFGRRNALFGRMMAEWTHIAGADVAARTIPADLKFSRKKDDKSAVLHLLAQPAYALELSYQKGVLIERLNIFFGYRAISDIKIIQHSGVMNKKPPVKPRPRPLTAQEQGKLDDMVGGIQENDLQTALKNLGKAILSRQNGNT